MEVRTGDPLAAVDRLSEAFARGYADHREIVRDGDLATLRDDPEFADLLRRMMDRPQPQMDRRSSWSPDGEWIAFTRVAGLSGTKEMYRIRPDGTELTRETGSPETLPAGRKSFPSWSPTGDRLVVSVSGPGIDDGIHIVHLDGSAPQRLTDQGDWPSFDPAGTSLLYDARHLWRVALTGGPSVPVSADSSIVWWASALAPDGRSVASSVFPRGGRINQVGVTDLESGSVRIVTPPNIDAFMPAWSPDGSRLTFAGSHNAFGRRRGDVHAFADR